MIAKYHSALMQNYEKLRIDEEKALELRKQEIAQRLPQIPVIEKTIAKISIEVSISSFRKIENRDEYLESLKNKITDLRMKKAELLVSNGYSQDYLTINYNCAKCKDTGIVNGAKCSCYLKKLANLYYQDSDLKELLRQNNFDTFNFEYFSNQRFGENPDSPRVNIEKNASIAMNFIRTFKSSNENLLFYGNPGTGKTFLTHCISKELLDNGLFVIYRTSEDLIRNLRSVRYENNTDLENLLLECDLLVIDDLGTEQINEFSKTELFNLLNKRLLKQKKMLISTNYSIKELASIYSERITSRLFGNFTLCKFFGEDIRVTINLRKR